jgi:glycerol uptake facilitator protein
MNGFIGELVGTAILILLGNGVVGTVVLNKSKGQNSGWIVITWGWGLAVAMAVYITGWMSGAHINPAVTIGLAAVGKFPVEQVPVYILAQLLGAMIGATLVWIFYRGHWEATDDPAGKQACFCTAPAVPNVLNNFLCEFIGTAMLLIGILGILHEQNHLGAGIGPFLIGLLIFSLGLSLGGTTGYAINPARDLGPRIMHAILPIAGKGGSGWGYAWIPIVAPIAGGVTGAALYVAITGMIVMP